jgi:alpha-ketoglutarate-dependent taurine dioxygenase
VPVITIPQEQSLMGVAVDGMDVLGAPDADLASLKQLVYTHKIVVLKNQRLDPVKRHFDLPERGSGLRRELSQIALEAPLSGA